MQGRKSIIITPGHRGPETGTYWTFSRKKKCNGNVTKQKIPYITFKKEQTSKQTKKKQKQNKTNPWSRYLAK